MMNSYMTSSSNTPDPSTTPIEWLAYGAPNAIGKTAAPSLITPIHTQNMVGEQRLSVGIAHIPGARTRFLDFDSEP
uniref:Uncharacterized protein n=1 Tax=Acrobeloides nanus TaxID=290746 RepID=A0A914DTZ5_9BILA